MPAWDSYKSEARGRGALALELYVVHSVPAGDGAAVKSALPDHLAYQAQLEAEGRLALAGPMSDESGTLMEGMGLIVYRAGSLEDARRLAEDDPMHKVGARRFTLRKWLVNEGSLSLTVGLSGRTVALS
ncbi:YciI family protein [Marinovum sp.]|uniref:YciI family protein n=1 Tax=Marinovum sp. TaxID=2024839 RepID=UPI002B26E5CB|nr:YciI family protein [Marinovum sp.]